MATSARSALDDLIEWTRREVTHETRLPGRMTITTREEIVDFMHGLMIGLLLGFFLGFVIKTVV
jgi:hypothetical protein